MLKQLLSLLVLLAALALVSCTKSEGDPISGPLPVTAAVQTGDWMVGTYMENGTNKSSEFGLTFLKFNTNGTVRADKDGAIYNGTWTETNTGGSNTLKLNLTTPDASLQKVNGTWKVAGVSEYYIDLKDGNASATNSAINLMKH